MSRDLRERRRHLDAVRGAFAPGAPVPSGLAPAVGDSWRRCADQVPARRTAPVEADDVEARWADSPLRQAATGIVDELADLAVAEDYVAAITDDTLPFGGRWTFDLSPEGAGTRVRIVEDGEVRDPLYRFFARFVFGQTGSMIAWLDALEADATR